MSEVRWIPLAEVARPHGVWGEVRLKVYNSDSELLFEQSEVLVRPPTQKESLMQLESLRGADSGYLIARFRGVDGRDAADLLRGAVICAPRDRFPPLGEGEFYVCDVIGAPLVGPFGEVGVVEDFVSYPTTEVLVVRMGPASRRAGASVELPLIDDFIDSVGDKVVLRPAGLEWIELTTAGTHRAN
jgi:16S rRNA processing protein RimM